MARKFKIVLQVAACNNSGYFHAQVGYPSIIVSGVISKHVKASLKVTPSAITYGYFDVNISISLRSSILTEVSHRTSKIHHQR